MDVFLSVRDLAERWQMAEQTIYNRISRGAQMPPSMRLGKRGARRWRLSDVQAFEEALIDSTSIDCDG